MALVDLGNVKGPQGDPPSLSDITITPETSVTIHGKTAHYMQNLGFICIDVSSTSTISSSTKIAQSNVNPSSYQYGVCIHDHINVANATLTSNGGLVINPGSNTIAAGTRFTCLIPFYKS